MSLRLRFFAYLAAVHLLAGAAALFALRKERALLLPIELLLAASLAAGFLLVRALFRPLDLMRQGASLLQEGDLSSRLRPFGSPELDALVALFNRMLERLHDERVRLEEQHFFLEKVLAASPVGILTLDLDGRIATANPAAAALLGPPGALLGRAAGELPAPFGETLAALRSGAGVVVGLGGGRRVRVQRSEFYDRGFPRAFFVLEELTEELRRFERAAYEKLIRMMSHEVNNSTAAVGSLLTSCLGYEPELPEADRAEFAGALTVARGRIEKLDGFMRALSEVVKLPAPRKAPLDPNVLAGDAVTLVRAEAARRGVALSFEPGEVPEAAMDRVLMEQALVNVLKNAMEAAGDGGRVTVRTRKEGRGLLEVEDSGPGIPDEVKAQLFTPFFTTKPDGQGIGLTLVREVLSAHGFACALDAPAGGSTRFTIRF